jgi:hypothetical protein
MTSIKTTLPALVLVFGLAGPLWAQALPLNPALRPAVSPYINLTRQGSSGGVNYYGLVKPDIQFRSGILQNQQEIANSQQAISSLAAGPITTGHRVGFMTQWRYFMNTGIGAPTSFRRTLGAQGSTSSAIPNVSRR